MNITIHPLFFSFVNKIVNTLAPLFSNSTVNKVGSVALGALAIVLSTAAMAIAVKQKMRSTPSYLFNAIKSHSLFKVRLALIMGANPNALNDNKLSPLYTLTPLFCAVRDDQKDIIKALLNAGADPACSRPGADPACSRPNDLTPLLHQAFFSEEDVFSQLLNLGANINVTNCLGLTILHRAIVDKCYNKIQNEKNFVMLALKSGVKIDSVDKDKQNALHYAIIQPSLSTFLLEEEKNLILQNVIQVIPKSQLKFMLNKQDKYGNAPLHYAVIFKKNEVISYFLKNGADPHLKNFQEPAPSYSDSGRKIPGNTSPLELAKQTGEESDRFFKHNPMLAVFNRCSVTKMSQKT